MAHTLFFKGYLIRNSLCGTVLSTPDRNAVVTRFSPQEKKREWTLLGDRGEMKSGIL